MDTARTIPSSWVQEALEAPCPLGKLFVTAPGSAFSRTSPPPRSVLNFSPYRACKGGTWAGVSCQGLAATQLLRLSRLPSVCSDTGGPGCP